MSSYVIGTLFSPLPLILAHELTVMCLNLKTDYLWRTMEHSACMFQVICTIQFAFTWMLYVLWIIPKPYCVEGWSVRWCCTLGCVKQPAWPHYSHMVDRCHNTPDVKFSQNKPWLFIVCDFRWSTRRTECWSLGVASCVWSSVRSQILFCEGIVLFLQSDSGALGKCLGKWCTCGKKQINPTNIRL